jgi:hypothetical protein
VKNIRTILSVVVVAFCFVISIQAVNSTRKLADESKQCNLNFHFVQDVNDAEFPCFGNEVIVDSITAVSSFSSSKFNYFSKNSFLSSSSKVNVFISKSLLNLFCKERKSISSSPCRYYVFALRKIVV